RGFAQKIAEEAWERPGTDFLCKAHGTGGRGVFVFTAIITAVLYNTDDLRIKDIKTLLTPEEIRKEYPASERATQVIHDTRQSAHRILHGADDRLVVVVGPCSIHDPKAALEYARKLKIQKERMVDELLIIMRVYFEKPRTTVGWKGLINDPHLDG